MHNHKLRKVKTGEHNMRKKRNILRLSLTLLFRRLTSRWRVFPSVFVVGATKAASSSITAIVWNHPAHVAPLTKEHMYLQQLPEFRSNYENTPIISKLWGGYKNGHARFTKKGFKKFFPLQISLWRRRYMTGQAFTSECDPFNFYCPQAMQRIKAICNKPKIIITLREPVARAYSDWNMHRNGGETRTFEECIEEEMNGTEKRFRKRFLNQSNYLPHLKRWLENFQPDEILILKAEGYFQNPEETRKKIYSFLQLEPSEVNWDKVNSRSNSRPYVKKIDKQTKEKLKDHFAHQNSELSKLIGSQFDWS